MTAATAPERGLARDTATLTALNLLSRLTGFVRVIAMAAALGATALGDTYQAANLVSNILFELLAGGLLAAVLVPVFVERIDRGDRDGAARLARAVLGRALAALTALTAVVMLAAPLLARLLTAGTTGAAREVQLDLATFLLWFFLPQIVLYGVGAVATALLQADRRFVAAALAPVCNNVVVIVTMLLFRAARDGATDLALSTDEKLLLALGTTGGVLAMTAAPLIAVARQRLSLRPRWRAGDGSLRPLARRGLWAAGHVGLNQAIVGVTIVLAARVTGGVVAYQVAFTFFLLPHAILANPVYTALYPRLSTHAQRADHDAFAAELGRGLRITAFVVVPAAGLLIALAQPALDLVRLGSLDAAGAELVATVLAAYATGLLGYSAFFLLTRASYALDDTRTPTLVNLVAFVLMAVGMIVGSSTIDGDGAVAVLGVVHAVGVTAASWALYRRVVGRIRIDVPVAAALGRALAVTALASVAAWAVADGLAGSDRLSLAIAVTGGVVIGGGGYLAGQLLLGAPELRWALRTVRGPR